MSGQDIASRDLPWRKSTRSANNGECVEVAILEDDCAGVFVRAETDALVFASDLDILLLDGDGQGRVELLNVVGEDEDICLRKMGETLGVNSQSVGAEGNRSEAVCAVAGGLDGEDFASLRESYRSSGYDRTARIEHLSAETASGLRKNTRRMREEDNEKQ